MLIDWFTIGAQALNFVILVWLLKRFLYKPILDAIDAREARIAAQIAAAELKDAEARAARAEFEDKNDDLDRQRAALLRQAADDARAEGQRLQGEAREEAERVSAQRHEALRNEADDLSLELGRRTRDEVFATVRKTLKDLASASLEERMCEVFNGRLRAMDSQAKTQLDAALKAAVRPALVRSAFALPAEQREAVQSAVNDTFSADIAVIFETSPELIGGIELIANGQRIAWSVDDYLGALQDSVVELLGAPVVAPQKVKSDTAPVSKGGADELSG